MEESKTTQAMAAKGDHKRPPQLTLEDIHNRFTFHPANTDNVRNAHEKVRTDCVTLALKLNNLLPEGREKALAMTKLEEVMFWANAGIARSKDGHA